MKISYSPYTLQPLAVLNAKAGSGTRDGILLKVQEADGSVGYADLHPWPELGDAPLSDEIESLRAGKVSSLLRQSLWLAQRDSQWRAQGQSVFSLGPSLKNNKTVTDLQQVTVAQAQAWRREGFEIVKLKMGRDLVQETACLNLLAEQGFRLRLDFNLSAEYSAVLAFLKSLSGKTLQAIDYIEDPCPWQESDWQSLRSYVPLAVDMSYPQIPWDILTAAPFDVLILKPAKMDVNKALQISDRWNLKITVTSMMDHPVGVMHALAVAMELKKARGEQILQAGCLTTSLYQANVFSEQILIHGPCIMQTAGTGIGFDQLWSQVPWRSL